MVAGKPISNYRLRTRQPPDSSPRVRAFTKPPLWEFVLLSMLLHATAILMFGAPSGGSREGRAMWGALQVVLQGAPVDAGPSLKIDRGLAEERPEIAKKAPPPKPEPRVEPVTPQLRIEPFLPPMESPPVEFAPRESAPVVIPPLLDRIVAPDRTPELVPFRLPPPTPVQVAPPPAPVAPAAPQPPAVEKPPVPRVERAIAEPPPMPAPVVVQPAPVPVPLPERVITTPTEIAPVASPVIPALPATPVVERPPVEVPALPAERVTPQQVPIATPQQVPIATPTPPAPAPMPQREAPARIERAPLPREEPALQPAPFRTPGPSIDSPASRAGEPATKSDRPAPTLDLDAMRQRAGELARSGTGNRAVLPFPMPPVPPKKSKMETAIENARKPDCRTAYAQLGLAAVVPLIANEFGEGTCRW